MISKKISKISKIETEGSLNYPKRLKKQISKDINASKDL